MNGLQYPMNSRERFLAACYSRPVDCIPIWVMRQAGRYLPEYRNLRSRYSFLELVKSPALVTEVTLQPLKRFNLDAAIIFSDILVIPEALGQPYLFKDTGGIQMQFIIETPEDLNRLKQVGAFERLQYVMQAIIATRSKLSPNKALLGFAGAPWTLATYMLEGGSPAPFTRIAHWMQAYPEALAELMDLLTDTLIHYLMGQIESGVDAVQIFDSWASALSDTDYSTWSLKWIQKIISALPSTVPVIVFAKGKAYLVSELLKTGAQVFAVDHSLELVSIRSALPTSYAVQGNLDPACMSGPVESMLNHTQHILQSMDGKPGFIFNLGHGITPSAHIENMHALVEYVHKYPVNL